MHMTCEQARQAAELPPSERGEPLSLALDQHLNGCETCRQSLLPDLRLEAWWEAVEQEVPAGLSERIMAAVRREVISETAPPETLPVMEFLRAGEEQAPYEADGKVIPLQTAQPSAQTALYSAPSWQKGRKKRRRMARQEKRRWTSFAAALAVLLLTPTLLHAVQRLTPLMDGGAETAQMEAVVEGSYGSSAGAATGPPGGAGAQAAEVPPAANDVLTADPPGEPAEEEPVPQPLYAEMSPAPNGDANEFNYSTDGDAFASEIGSSSPDVTMRAQEDGGVDPLMVSKRLSLPAASRYTNRHSTMWPALLPTVFVQSVDQVREVMHRDAPPEAWLECVDAGPWLCYVTPVEDGFGLCFVDKSLTDPGVDPAAFSDVDKME